MAEKLFMGFYKLIKQLGEYLEETGWIEKENPEIKKFLDESKNNPEKLLDLIKSLPQKYSEKILDTFLRMLLLSNRIGKVDEMTAEEKIELGAKLKKISEEFKDIFDEMKSEGD